MTANTCDRCRRPASDYLCWECVRSLRGKLLGLIAAVQQLEVTATRQSRTGSREGPATSESVLMFGQLDGQLDAAACLTRIRSTIGVWARDLCETHGLTFVPLGSGWIDPDFIGPLREGRKRVPPDYVASTVDIARWLRRNAGLLRLEEDARDRYYQVIGMRDRALKLVDAPQPKIPLGPCPHVRGHDDRGKPVACGHKLSADRDRDEFRCPRCGTAYEVEAMKEWLLGQMRDMLMDRGELLRTMELYGEPVTEKEFSRWRRERLLRPRAWKYQGRITNIKIHRNDPPLFRLGDVMDLAAKVDMEGAETA